MTVAILGAGAIGSYVLGHLPAGFVSALLVRPSRVTEEPDGPPRVARVADLPRGTRLLVDCAGHGGLVAHGAEALAAGIDVLTLSLGALADAALADRLQAAASAGTARLRLASGAIGGLDVLRAARAAGALERVTYTGRKPPEGWRGSPAEDRIDLARPLSAPVTHFEGSAREAALGYPKNANVAAAVALSGLGFDATTVALIADPEVTANTHDITASGAFGDMRITIAGQSLPGAPRSSALAALSLVAAIDGRDAWMTFDGG
ncbi:aspartate dehydrogenase [uncultured Jannaschia sp.]|uniref:aspartate dehydrogenase n=1 Tax=uncultured Jannaschia sp. TaxID=293347 RepID=UPI00261BD7F5|nr:aspartate dehydrogenase [uncultured Jannaschia sp.]